MVLKSKTEISGSIITFKESWGSGFMAEIYSDLFFEFSHEDRVKILLEIDKAPSKLSHLSEKLDLKVQETARHLSRLTEAKLISKDINGDYRATPYGDHVLRLLPGFNFLRRHREYFTTHRSAHLPIEFVGRIGELSMCKFTDNVMAAYQEVRSIYEEAQEYIWGLSDQITPYSPPFIDSAMKRGVKVRLLLLEGMVFPPGFEPVSFVPGRIEHKTLDKLDIGMVVSEKKATIVFPTSEGKLDPSMAFISTDNTSKMWVSDLFEFYWSKAKIGTPDSYPHPNR
jgi:predicted transcriptional regulator